MAYDVILDTGSADMFLVSSSCTTQTCSGLQTYSGSSSSTFNSTTQPFSITYGSGTASGVLASDVVQMAGFQVSQQTFGISFSITCLLRPSLTNFFKPRSLRFLTVWCLHPYRALWVSAGKASHPQALSLSGSPYSRATSGMNHSWPSISRAS